VSEALVVLLGESPEEAVVWTAFDAGARVETGRAETIEALSAVVEARGPFQKVIGALPGEQATVRALASPPKSTAKFRAAARLLLEDELAEAADKVHVAVHAEAADGLVIAVRPEIVAGWLEAFRSIDAPLSILTVDYLCLPRGRDRAMIAASGDRLIVRADAAGFAAERSLAAPLLAAALADAGMSGVDLLGEDADLAAHLTAQGVDVSLTPTLLQGAYRPMRARLVRLDEWRRAGLMAAGLALAFLVLAIADGVRNGAIAERYEDAARRAYYEAFPDAEGRDIRSDARARLAAGGGADFSEVAARLDAALADNQNVSIERMVFDASRGEIIFSIKSASDGAIEAFRRSLAGAVVYEIGAQPRKPDDRIELAQGLVPGRRQARADGLAEDEGGHALGGHAREPAGGFGR